MLEWVAKKTTRGLYTYVIKREKKVNKITQKENKKQ